MKAGHKYDRIVHSQKQQSLARLNNPSFVESKHFCYKPVDLESSPDEDFYEESPVQVREVHH